MSLDIVVEKVAEEDKKTLDFEEIRKLSLEVRKRKTSEETLSEEDIKEIPLLVEDMVKHIKRYAKSGKTEFRYDCSKLSKTLYHATVEEFKRINPKFFVVNDYGQQMIIVDWSNKQEV